MTDEIVIETIVDDDTPGINIPIHSKGGKKTSAVISKYEFTTLVWCRALQISNGDPPKVDPDGSVVPIDIAIKELEERKIPLVIERQLPNGGSEYWNPNEMNLLTY